MGRGKNRQRGPRRCTGCRAVFEWFSLRGEWRKFDPTPVDGRTHIGAHAYPVPGKQAWRRADLVEHLIATREVSQAAAEDEVYDMPWHVLHACPHDHEKDLNR